MLSLLLILTLKEWLVLLKRKGIEDYGPSCGDIRQLKEQKRQMKKVRALAMSLIYKCSLNVNDGKARQIVVRSHEDCGKELFHSCRTSKGKKRTEVDSIPNQELLKPLKSARHLHTPN